MRCSRCGYDITPTAPRPCPECGAPSPPLRPPLRPASPLPLALGIGIGALGWLAFLLPLLGLLFRMFSRGGNGSGAILALVCPGIPIFIALLITIPWYRTARDLLTRSDTPTVDCVFLAVIPWVPGLMMAIPLLTG
jgi:hypothetical protein